MKLASLNLSIYLAAFAAHSMVAHAELVGASQSQQAPPPSQAPAAPLNIQPPVVSEGEGEGVDPRIGPSAGSETEIREKLKNYDLVVVIDKATQSLTAWRNSSPNPAEVTASVALKGPVSTGTEARECLYVRSKVPNERGYYLYTKARAIFRNTPTGYYVPSKIEASHFSSEYDAAPMPNAVGWLASEGIYTHSKTADEGPLGHIASHGCVRQSFRDSRDLFTMVAMTSDKFDPNDDAFHARCPKDPDTNQCSRPADSNEEHELQDYFSKIKNGIYPRVIIDPKNPKNNHDLKSNMPRLSPRDTNTRPVLKIDKRGNYVKDPVTGAAILSTSPYNTLYIVKDSRIGTTKDKDTLPPAPIACKSLKQLNEAVLSGADPSPDVQAGAGSTAPQQSGWGQPLDPNPFSQGGLFGRIFNQGGNTQPQQPPRRQGNR